MKILFTTAFTLCFVVLAQAQLIPSIGLHGYLNERVDAINGEVADISLQGRHGWHAGADFRISKKVLYIQPGLHYYNTSSEVVDLREINLPQKLGKQQHVSLKVPLQAGLRIGLNGTAALHLQGGPVATASIREKLVDDLGGQRDLSFGLVSGLSLDLLRFNVHARYEWGLTQAWENSAGTADVLSVGLGIVF